MRLMVLKSYMKLLWRLAQGSVVLFHKVPANLVLRQVAIASRASRGGISRSGGGWVLLTPALVLVLLGEAAVGRHRLGEIKVRKTLLSTSQMAEEFPIEWIGK